MTTRERVIENMNQALHTVFAQEPQVFLIGEDILDPYGGAFKVSSGLSSLYPDRVLTTPISEEAMLGVAGGLALCGDKPIVEMMFGDFIGLGFDQILNFATKSVSMYGRTLDINLVIRCPVGGNRGYGPTHSQSLQKHFIGIPNLALFELSPFHDNTVLLNKLIRFGCPTILFENKTLYTQQMYHDGVLDELFVFEFLDQENNFVRVYSKEYDTAACTIITTGGTIKQCLAAAKQLFIDDEIFTQIIVPSQLYPLNINPILDLLEHTQSIFIVEESIAGGTWGNEVAMLIYNKLWNKLKSKIHLVHSKDSIIPSSMHLEKRVLLQEETIYNAIKEQTNA